MRYILIIILLLLCCFHGFSQPGEGDVVRDNLIKAKNYLLKGTTNEKYISDEEYEWMAQCNIQSLHYSIKAKELYDAKRFDTTIILAQQAIYLAGDKPGSEIAALLAHTIMARVFRNLELHDLSVSSYKEALDQIRQLRKQPTFKDLDWTCFNEYQNYQSIAREYILNGDTTNAKEFYQKANSLVPCLGQEIYLITAYRNIGRGYTFLNQPDSAILLLQKGLQLRNDKNEVNVTKCAQIFDALKRQYVILGQYDSAAMYSVAEYELRGPPKSSFEFGPYAVVNLVKSGNLQKAAALLDELTGVFKKKKKPELKETKDYYMAHLELAISKGNANQANQYRDSVNVYTLLIQEQENISRTNTLKSLLKSIENRALDQLAIEKSRQESLLQKNRIQRQLFIIIGLVISFIAILAYTTIRRRLTRAREKQELLKVTNELTAIELRNKELEEQRLQQEINMQQKDITDLAMGFNLRREIINEISDQLDKISRKDPDKLKQATRDLSMELRLKLQEEDKTETLLENIEKVNHQFYATLSENLPNLTKSEKELCAMIRMGLTNKEIAAMRNVTGNTVKSLRYRLRKKLPIDDEASMDDYIRKL